jgi:ribosomal protein L37AE/L43A
MQSQKILFKINLNTFTLQNNIIEIAPSNINVVDRIERVITEATLLLEGSNQIYKENCPLCGSKSVRRRETGEYCCEACDGVWTANTINNLDTIWLKRIRLK